MEAQSSATGAIVRTVWTISSRLRFPRNPARLGLRILHTLTLDDESKYLRNTQSAYALATANGEAILTYDFVRPAPNVYPEAHLHIDGESASLQRLLDLSGPTLCFDAVVGA